ncbi:hypothetical protein B2J93_5170 [Marssonina coronariae]|uniref:Uncharacterized protein n=1 Tax=Diplocarpon coronariae TaxID=2795749 RepID=A0A218ZF24_9HELO|nr:hypothetical protein B2J93_5170 [Marssonina coronariae]
MLPGGIVQECVETAASRPARIPSPAQLTSPPSHLISATVEDRMAPERRRAHAGTRPRSWIPLPPTRLLISPCADVPASPSISPPPPMPICSPSHPALTAPREGRSGAVA